MEIDLACSNCNNEYHKDNPARLLPCGHTFCHSCLAGMFINSKDRSQLVCPEDQQSLTLSGTVQDLPKNLALMKFVEARRNNSNNSGESIRDASFDMSKITKEQQCQQDDLAQQLITEINRAVKSTQDDELLEPQFNVDVKTDDTEKQHNGSTQKIAAKIDIQVCLLHQKPIEFICMNDYERLCSKCALFGQHKNHQMQGIEEIMQENKKSYHEIIDIFEGKALLQEKIANNTVEKDLIELLSVKTNKLKKEINEKFKKIADELAKAQKNAMKSLEEASKSIEIKLMQSLKPDSKITLQYDSWEAQTLEMIKQSQKPSKQGHLDFYLKRQSVVRQGKQFLSQLKSIQTQAYSETVEKVEKLAVSFLDQGLQQFFSNLVIIRDNDEKLSNTNFLGSDINSYALATCKVEQIKKSPRLQRHQSQQSLLDMCQFETHSFAGSNVGSTFLDQSFVSVQGQLNGHHAKEYYVKPTVKRKIMGVNPKEKGAILSQSVNITTATKRKPKALKVPQKYEKVIEGITHDSLQVVDLTNAQLGDALVLQILQLMKDSSKVKTLKLIRNKLTDDGIVKMLPYFVGLTSLNLSQNQLTDHSLSLFLDNRGNFPHLRSLVMCQTKIVERKSKGLMEKLKKMDLAVSV